MTKTIMNGNTTGLVLGNCAIVNDMYFQWQKFNIKFYILKIIIVLSLAVIYIVIKL